jgi:cytochrome b561
MTICSPTQVRNWSRVRDGRRRFDSLTIGLHWATVALITGMFASAWVLLASDREHAAILLNVHRSLGVVTWAVAIVRLAWRDRLTRVRYSKRASAVAPHVRCYW